MIRQPFVPTDRQNREKRCDEILMIQAMGLKKRLEHTGANAVVGISGGLDSTLALLVTVRAFDLCGRDHKGNYGRHHAGIPGQPTAHMTMLSN